MNTAEVLSTQKGYVSRNMKRLGRGSSRIVYGINDNKTVVKYALPNRKGVAQNRAEYEVYENAKTYITLLCPIFDISYNSEALIMSKAIPLRSKDMPVKYKEKITIFRKKLKFIKKYHSYLLKSKSIKEIKNKLYKSKLTEDEKKIVKSSFFKQICELLVNHDLLLGDITTETSWGIYRGRFVLLDYGCTKEVYSKYYRYA